MAALQSENIDKVKKSNQKEEIRMRLQTSEIQKQRQQLLNNLQKEQLRMVHQVKANRIRELRQTLREGLGMEEQVNMMRQKAFPGSIKNTGIMLRQETKGFSKVDVDDEDDDDIYMEYIQQKNNPKLHVLQARWVKRREREDEEIGKKEPKYDINDDEVFVRYPCEINQNTRGVITLRDLRDLQKGQYHSRFKSEKPVKTVSLQRSRYPLPKVVGQLQKLGDVEYDEFTDGAMALDVRRFKQKQRERTPVPVGFLPVRRRYIDEFDYLYDENRHSANVGSSAPAMSIHGKPPTAVRIYVPKTAEQKPESEEQEEHRRLLKLRKADQADLYQDSIEQTSMFLGQTAKHHQKLVPKERLSREETIMLHQLKQVPAFRSGSKMVKSAPASRYARSQAPTRSSKNSSQIREIMTYVLNKDYTGSTRTGPPPKHLDYESEESD